MWMVFYLSSFNFSFSPNGYIGVHKVVITLFDIEEFFSGFLGTKILATCSTIHINIFSSPKSRICPHLMQIFQPI